VTHRALSAPGVEEYVEEKGDYAGQIRHRKWGKWGKKVNGQVVLVEGYTPWDGFAHSKGWHAAADVLVEDMYIVWRAQLGLPVWPDYHAAKLGYSHNGKICVDAPRTMTLEEAKAFVKA